MECFSQFYKESKYCSSIVNLKMKWVESNLLIIRFLNMELFDKKVKYSKYHCPTATNIHWLIYASNTLFNMLITKKKTVYAYHVRLLLP